MQKRLLHQFLSLLPTLMRFLGYQSEIKLLRNTLNSLLRAKRPTYLPAKPISPSFYLRSRIFSTSRMAGEDETKKPFKRLPMSVVPSNYQITLQPNLQDFKFKGSQIVELEVIYI